MIRVRFLQCLEIEVDFNFFHFIGDVVLIEGQSGGSIVGITPGAALGCGGSIVGITPGLLSPSTDFILNLLIVFVI